MGDRIVVEITDGKEFSPSFYGHWCGLRAVKTMNDLVRQGEHNGIQSLMCNFITEIMENRPQRYSYYIYNRGEVDGAADWDQYTWTIDIRKQVWTTTDPNLKDRELTLGEADEYVRKDRPCLYRKCKCEDYGKSTCALRFYELQEGKQ